MRIKLKKFLCAKWFIIDKQTSFFDLILICCKNIIGKVDCNVIVDKLKVENDRQDKSFQKLLYYYQIYNKISYQNRFYCNYCYDLKCLVCFYCLL